jgi:hypothetical protein
LHIFSLKDQEAVWKKYVSDNDSNETLLANCITAAAFLTYCGPLNTDTRQKLGKFFMMQCDAHGIKMGKRQLFYDMELVDFLYTPVSIIFDVNLHVGHQARLPSLTLFTVQSNISYKNISSILPNEICQFLPA